MCICVSLHVCICLSMCSRALALRYCDYVCVCACVRARIWKVVCIDVGCLHGDEGTRDVEQVVKSQPTKQENGERRTIRFLQLEQQQ